MAKAKKASKKSVSAFPTVQGQMDELLSFARWSLAAVTVIVLCAALVVTMWSREDYSKRRLETQKHGELIAEELRNETRLIISLADQILVRAAERQFFSNFVGDASNDDVGRMLRALIGDSKYFSVMAIADEWGKVRAAYQSAGDENWTWTKSDVGYEKYFSSHINKKDVSFRYIGWSDEGAPHGMIMMSRSIRTADRRFAGTVIIGIRPEFLEDKLDSLKRGNKERIGVFSDSKLFLTSVNSKDPMMKMLLSEHDNYNNMPDSTGISPKAYSTIIETGRNDADMVTFHTLPGGFLQVAVVQDMKDALKRWRDTLISQLTLLTVLVLMLILLHIFMYKATNRVQSAIKKEQTALDESRAKSEFLANMSHELRTPLNAIIGFSEMLGSGYFGAVVPEQKERLKDINSCGSHLLELINDILDYSKGLAGKIELVSREFDISRLISDTTRIFKDRYHSKGVEFIADIPETLPPILGDERRIRQILLNLLSNSAKFTDPGGVVKTSAYVDEDGWLVVSVTDTGRGMDEENIPKAMTPYGQAHTDSVHMGTGLGLPLCRMFAELHGGEFYIQSATGVGTRASFRLPPETVLQYIPSRI